MLHGMGDSSKKSVLVSGCSTSFGRRAVRALAARGHTVVAGLPAPHGRHADQVEALAEVATVVSLDVDHDDSVNAGVAAALEATGGRIDVLVNTAAYTVMGPLEACPPDQLLSMLNTNLVGALRLFRAVLPVMRAAGAGRIVQFTSGLGRAVVPFMGVYSAGAWAQECFAEALHYEASAFGVEVTILEPAGYRDEGLPRKPVGDADRLAPYHAQLVALAERMQCVDQAPSGDPAEVSAAVVNAVEAHTTALRTPIGFAAHELLELRTRLTAAEYEAEIMKRTGLA